MASPNESRFLSSLAESQKAVNDLSSVLNMINPPSNTTVQLARQKLGDLKLDAATYLAGNKSKAVILKLINATDNWDSNKAKGESINTIARRVSRYLVEIQTIVGLPENQVPAVGEDEAGRAAQAIAEAGKKAKDKADKEGIKISGGMIAAVGAGVLGLLWFLKRK